MRIMKMRDVKMRPIFLLIYSDVIKDGQRRRGVLATIRVYFDAENLLETIFWKSARGKK